MNLTCLRKDERLLEVQGAMEDESALRLLQSRIVNDPDVVRAMVVKAHPTLAPPILVLETRTKRPEDLLKGASRELVEQVDGLLQQFAQARAAGHGKPAST